MVNTTEDRSGPESRNAGLALDRAMAGLDSVRASLEDLYRDLHAHPEPAFEEHRTAARVAEEARAAGYDVTTGVGRTGIVAVLRNGAGPTVFLRADMDALPVREDTGLPYSSTVDGLMHACGHDMHTVCLLGALRLLAASRDQWSGTVLAVFQPAEEVGAGAAAMVGDDLFRRFGTPSVVLGQHVAPLPAGWIGCHPGPAFAGTDSLRIRLHGHGGHGSRPETTVDPVVMAAAAVLRLQTVVSREVAPGDSAVVTIGTLNAGSQDNIIPEWADLGVNVRTFDTRVRERVLAAISRIANAEAAAGGAPRDPEVTLANSFPTVVNDEAAMIRTGAALRAAFGEAAVIDPGPVTGSEDVGHFGTSSGAPVCYWLFGGADPDLFQRAIAAGTAERDIPSNHSPHFAPLLQPTLDSGVQALVCGALAWLAPAS
jgi:amidohydrolase